MARLLVVILVILCASVAHAEMSQSEKHKFACKAFSQTTKGMTGAIVKQRQGYAGTGFRDLKANLPKSAADAAEAAQLAQEEADKSLKVFQERMEDLVYQLKLCAR